MWWILYPAAAVALVSHWGSKNAVWGTAILGALIGLIAAIVWPAFDWGMIGKAFVIGSLIGLVFEWLLRLIRRPQRHPDESFDDADLYESIRHRLTDQDVDELFATIAKSDSAPAVDKEVAKNGLSKLLGNEVAEMPTRPEIDALSKFFPRALINAISEKRIHSD